MQSICSFLFIYIFLQLPLLSQSESAILKPEEKIPKEKLLKDLEISQTNLYQVHSGLYTYYPKERFDNFFQEIEGKCTQASSSIEFYRALLPLHGLIQNGHTFLIPPEDWSQAVEHRLPHFPFDIYPYKERIYILRNLSLEEKIQAGDELLRINGVDAFQVFKQLRDSWTRDGENRTFPTEIVSQDFSEFYANVLGTPDSFSIQIKRDKQEESFTIKALALVKLRELSKDRYQYEKRPWYNDRPSSPTSFQIKHEVGILYLPSFSIYQLKEDKIKYKAFFRKVFEELDEKNIENLIIDIRDNGGGHGDVAAELFSYLHDKDFYLLSEIYSKINTLKDKGLYEDSSWLLRIQMKLALKKIEKGKFVPKNFAAKRNHLRLSKHKASSPMYSGKLYILQGGWSFSASGMFTGLLKNYKKGIIIGEEAGGNPHTQVGDFEQMLVLPHSKVRMRIPLFYERMAVDFENSGHGLTPQHIIRPSIEDKIKGKDPVMDFTLELIRKTKP
ncbi:MAG: S41 family peptidase [Bacteroidota bacterium]